MKIIHCADVHIGTVFGQIGSKKREIRKQELVDSFLDMLEYAKKNGVEAVLIAGDLFENNKVAYKYKKDFIRAVTKYSKIKFLYLMGNHDKGISFEDLEMPSNLVVAGDNALQSIPVGNAVVTMGVKAGVYDKLELQSDDFNILMLHGDIDSVQVNKLAGINIDYLALGDRHIPDTTAQKLDKRGTYGYSGSFMGRGFDELGERGFVLLDYTDGKFKREFVPFAKRQYVRRSVDISGIETEAQLFKEIEKEVKSVKKEHIVSIELIGKYTYELEKHIDTIRDMIIDKCGFFDVQIKDSSVLDRRAVKFENEISLTKQFVDIVNSCELDDKKKDKVLEYGLKALKGVKISCDL